MIILPVNKPVPLKYLFSIAIISFLAFLSACSTDTNGNNNDTTSKSDDESSDSDTPFIIEEAKWDSEKNRLTVKGKGKDNESVAVTNASTNAIIGNDNISDNNWKIKEEYLDIIPCRVRATQSNGQIDEKNIEDAPDNCDGSTNPPTDNTNTAPTLSPIGDKSVVTGNTLEFTVNATDDGLPDNTLNITASPLPAGASLIDNGDGSALFSWAKADPVGSTLITFTVSDGLLTDAETISLSVTAQPPSNSPNVSINSTSRNGPLSMTSVTEQQPGGQSAYAVFASNDLGMHCGDFDTRISSILPPFNVLHAQVIRKDLEPDILTPTNGTRVSYSATSSATDPVLAGLSPSGQPLRYSTVNGNVFKTNFWDIALGSNESIALKAYRPFYPPGVLDIYTPLADQGLPVPDTERLYLGDGTLTVVQASMPGILSAYNANSPQNFNQFVSSLPFFTDFPFGYTSQNVNWFEAAGVPLSAFDDAGRENPYPLLRVQAKDSNGTLLASVDTVAPISGESNCQGCHGAPVDGGNGSATRNMNNLATTLDDPMLDQVPLLVSQEYAADINILRLHDQKHGTNLESTTPVVCQTCHYTPALDLAQVGPRGPENDSSPGNPSNGRDQVTNKSMSNVMHSHHATVTDASGKPLFPSMPPPIDASGQLRDPLLADNILQQTCYQCHPGRQTSCLRGAMESGGMLCQDCHGDMKQIGDDFSRNVSATNPGAFELASDFYTNPSTPRVPWANVPGCGSCHTGDVLNNMHNDTNTLGAPDGIRLMQAWLKNDPKATPIVPTNKRFAEPVVASTGNPQLYRISAGHKGVQCESCHGATHAIWPNGNPVANDNVAAIQLQGHSGLISECSTCHTGDLGINLDGPHGMHPVGTAGAKFADGGHDDFAENNPNACRACHGRNGEGTVLSAMKTDRILKCDKRTAFCPDGNSVLFPKGHQVTCSDCHSNKL